MKIKFILSILLVALQYPLVAQADIKSFVSVDRKELASLKSALEKKYPSKEAWDLRKGYRSTFKCNGKALYATSHFDLDGEELSFKRCGSGGCMVELWRAEEGVMKFVSGHQLIDFHGKPEGEKDCYRFEVTVHGSYLNRAGSDYGVGTIDFKKGIKSFVENRKQDKQ